MTVQINKIIFGELADKYQKIKIPDYQRDFDWSSNQFKLLWKDLNDHLATRGEYFIGPLNAEKMAMGDGIEIADGQQRLTSLMILLAALKCHIGKEEEELLKDIDKLLFVDKPKKELRLIDPTSEGSAYLQGALTKESLFEDGLTIKHRIAFNFFYGKASELSEKERVDLATLILDEVVFALVVAQEQGKGIQMFERANTRGRPLTLIDNLKSLLISQSGTQSRVVISNWSTTTKNLRDANKYQDGTFVYWLLSDYGQGTKLQASRALDFARDQISDEKTCLECSKQLLSYSEAIKNISRGLTPSGGVASGSLENLNMFRRFTQLQTLLPAARNWSEEQFLDLAEAVENTVCVVAVANAFPPDIEKKIPNLLLKIRDADDESLSEVKRVLREIRNGLSGKFGHNFVNGTYRQSQRDTLIVLWGLMGQHMQRVKRSRKKRPRREKAHDDDMTVEHILPQKPSKAAKTQYGQHHPVDRYRLGNCTPLEYNYGNDTYKEKQKVYKTSKYELTNSMVIKALKGTKEWKTLRETVLPTYKKWDHNQLKKRSENLYKLACEALDFDVDENVKFEEGKYLWFEDESSLPRESSPVTLASELVRLKNDETVVPKVRSTLKFLELLDEVDGEEQLSALGEKFASMSQDERLNEIKKCIENNAYVKMYADLKDTARKKYQKTLQENIQELRDVKSPKIVKQIEDCLEAWRDDLYVV